MASLKIAYITVGEQITAEQFIEKCKVMTICKAMIMNIGITSVVAPRLRATGVAYIASPKIKSSGNTQHPGTENNHFIDSSGNIVRYYIK